jgi:hypothetical protein
MFSLGYHILKSTATGERKTPLPGTAAGTPHFVGKKRDRKEDLKDLGSRLPITFIAIAYCPFMSWI